MKTLSLKTLSLKTLSVRLCLGICLLGLLITACQLQPPVSVGQRESKIGQGMIILVTNTSENPLQDIRIRVEGPDGEAREHFEASMGPREVLEVGWLKLDGWPVPQGANVEVSVKDYSMSVKASL